MMALLGPVADDMLEWLLFAAVLGFWGFHSYRRSGDRRLLLIKWACSAFLILSCFFIAWLHNVILSLLYIIPCVLFAFLWLPSVGEFLLKPLTSAFEGGSESVEAKPFYFRAVAKRRKSLYDEAMADIRQQLESFPGDPEGMMMLAAIQAEDVHDVPAGMATLNELLDKPGLPAARTIAVLQTLADWHLNLASDPAAARATLERIIDGFPGTQASLAAQQRVARLEGFAGTKNFRDNAVFKVQPRENTGGLRLNMPQALSTEQDPLAEAAEFVKQLQKYPSDVATREKLALLYAEQLGRLDLAVSELEQLASVPNASSRQIAQWLGLLATLHIRFGNDIASAEKALRRIIEKFPKTAAATQAESRLATLQGELKAASAAAASMALGSYEKDLGLRTGKPYPPREV